MLKTQKTMVFLLVLFIASVSFASDDFESSPLVKVIHPKRRGTGVVFRTLESKKISDGYEGYVMTAYHVVKGDERVKVKYTNGRVAKDCTVLHTDPESDVAILWAWVPENVKPIKISTRAAQYNDTIRYMGLGGGIDITEKNRIRDFTGKVSAPTGNISIFSDNVLIPGDSGGPVLLNGDLVGVICGGLMTYHLKPEEGQENGQRVVWPARSCNLGPIRKLIEKLK